MRPPATILDLVEDIEAADIFDFNLGFAPLSAPTGSDNLPDFLPGLPPVESLPSEDNSFKGTSRPDTGKQGEAPDVAADAAADGIAVAFPFGKEEETSDIVNFTGLEWHVHDSHGGHDHETIDAFANAKPDGKGGGRPNPTEPPEEEPPTDPPADPTAATSFWSVTFGAADDAFDNYNIELQFFGSADLWGATADAIGGYTGGLIDAFLGSAEFLTSIIAQGYAADTYDGPYADLENGLTLTTNTAEDIVIEAYLSDIDGVGGILGRAGSYDQPDADNDDVLEGLPTAGLMEFDVADAGDLLSGATQGGLWDDTVLHEMIHVLGFGTLWDFETEGDVVSGWDTLVTDQLYVFDNGTRKPSDDVRAYAYTGTEANSQLVANEDSYWEIDGELLAAVESTGGAGTARGHWSEAFYGNEIMTGFINSLNDGANVGANYMDDITVAALADLGYTMETDETGAVDYDAMAASGTHFLETGEFVHWSEFDAIA